MKIFKDVNKNGINERLKSFREVLKKENGKRHSNSKKILVQISMEGKEIKEWRLLIEAAKTLSISPGNISLAATSERSSAGGFKWKYKSKLTPFDKTKGRSKAS